MPKMLEAALVVEGLDVMRRLKTLIIATSISANAFTSAAVIAAQHTPATPPIRLAAWKGDFNSMQNDHLSELPPVLAPMDDSPTAEIPQDVPVEAVPTPTAVTSGLLVLGGLASIRLFRRLRMS